MDGFTAVPRHSGFWAKRVFEEAGRVLDVSAAHLEPRGGGSVPAHAHSGRDHLLIVTQGVMEARTPEGVRRFGPSEALPVPGGQVHEA